MMKVEDFQQELVLGPHLATGFYWVKVEHDGMVGTRPLVVR